MTSVVGDTRVPSDPEPLPPSNGRNWTSRQDAVEHELGTVRTHALLSKPLGFAKPHVAHKGIHQPSPGGAI
jgi:hypothetical protein